LFIPKLIYEYGEPEWNDTDRAKTEDIGEKPGSNGKKNEIFSQGSRSPGRDSNPGSPQYEA
jgi:hypothetical protein